jgi:hypothetical protein
MSLRHETLAARFRIDVGRDLDTGTEVASVVRDDERFLNLDIVDALITLGDNDPNVFDTVTQLIFDLTDDSEGVTA